MFAKLYWWMDEVVRGGAENMAVDEWLAETVDEPFLRCYRWEAGWGSLGYFGKRKELPDWPVRWVRRWTGGGIVDHRDDFTYTLVVPRGHEIAELRGGESYRRIHLAVAKALALAGRGVRMKGAGLVAPGGECFAKPVEFDLLGEDGRKLAGAGQRRTRKGLLHQGSLAGRLFEGREELLAKAMSEQIECVGFLPERDDGWKARVLRYGSEEWMERR